MQIGCESSEFIAFIKGDILLRVWLDDGYGSRNGCSLNSWQGVVVDVSVVQTLQVQTVL